MGRISNPGMFSKKYLLNLFNASEREATSEMCYQILILKA